MTIPPNITSRCVERAPGHDLAATARPISRYMTGRPFTIGRWDSLARARQLMRDHAIRHLPVLDAGRLVGVVRSDDLRLLETIAGFPLDAVDVDEAMIARPYTIAPDTPLDEVIEVLMERADGCAIVVAPGEVVKGIFTAIDAMRVLSELLRGSSQAPNGEQHAE